MKTGAPKRVKWTYKAQLDYISAPNKKGEYVLGFHNSEGEVYECPITTDTELIKKLEEISMLSPTGLLRVTVEVNEKMDSVGREFPVPSFNQHRTNQC